MNQAMYPQMAPASVPSYGSSSHLAPSSPATEIREGSVLAEIRELHAQLQQLDDLTGKLRSKLSPAMLDRPLAQGAQGPVGNPIQRCEVAGQIHAAVDLACNISAKVTDMLCCLEL